ncbi:hypothetical protein HV819_01945 [Anaerococcus sp. AGMB00486]|uniref:DUF3592 domain-containing protein n=1 Tax=Anaerococcus faecalis TaxID=2742993 RepID=A0ABX2N7V8_9FIRM|nr:hypothetical protein [Anaerococcus faecalis]NVF10772.1 hypothetical protein [Anaerococcus faecalis]
MEKQFIYISATILLILGLVDFGRSYILRNNTDYTSGKIISIWQPNPKSVKKGNSKWAQFEYSINGKTYVSKNKIQVPMSMEMGDIKKIKYSKKDHEKIYSFSLKRAIMLCIVSAMLFIVGKFDLL